MADKKPHRWWIAAVAVPLAVAFIGLVPQLRPPAGSRPSPKGPVRVPSPADCPPGFSVIRSSTFDHVNVGVSYPAGAPVCIVDATMTNTRTGVEVRSVPRR